MNLDLQEIEIPSFVNGNVSKKMVKGFDMLSKEEKQQVLSQLTNQYD